MDSLQEALLRRKNTALKNEVLRLTNALDAIVEAGLSAEDKGMYAREALLSNLFETRIELEEAITKGVVTEWGKQEA